MNLPPEARIWFPYWQEGVRAMRSVSLLKQGDP